MFVLDGTPCCAVQEEEEEEEEEKEEEKQEEHMFRFSGCRLVWMRVLVH